MEVESAEWVKARGSLVGIGEVCSLSVVDVPIQPGKNFLILSDGVCGSLNRSSVRSIVDILNAVEGQGAEALAAIKIEDDKSMIWIRSSAAVAKKIA
jgi:hypothetical protein